MAKSKSKPKPEPVLFSYRELAEVLARHRGIDDGHWGVFMRFGLAATIGNLPDSQLTPMAILPVTEIGISRFDAPNELTVDASQFNVVAKIKGTAKIKKKK